MGSCGGGTPCGSPQKIRTSEQLLIYSEVGHTLREAGLVASRAGAQARVSGRVCAIVGDRLDDVVIAMAERLSSPELEEMRALFVPEDGGGDQLELGLGARSLAMLVGQVRHRELVDFASDERRFYSRYQPIIDLGSERTVAFEALLRATEDDGSERSAPALFGAAEEAGLTNLLDRIGREAAIRDAAPWLGDRDLFINFVPTSIYRPEVCLATTAAAARTHGVDVGNLVFEVVETHEVSDVGHLLDIVAYYREQGSRVALDDVGAGFANLNLVARVAPDVVKVDQALVQALPDPVAVAVVGALIDMTHGYGGVVLAEGVETGEQASVARDLGADLAQGYFFGRPERPDQRLATTGRSVG